MVSDPVDTTGMPWHVEYLQAIDSTNSELLRRVEAGQAVPGQVLITDQQTAGRGRRGRTWHNAAGQLLMSCLVTDHERIGPLWSLLAGLSVCHGVRAMINDPASARRIGLKWPNDLMIDDLKAGGILIERAGTATPWQVVIGIGINLLPATLADRPAGDIGMLGAGIERDALAEHILAAMGHRRTNLARDGRPGLIRDWLAQAWRLGGSVSCHAGDRLVQGRFQGLDEDGNLLLLTASGATRVINAGEVMFDTTTTMPMAGPEEG